MTETPKESAEEIPSLEPWLIMAIGGFVPMTAAFMVDHEYMSYLIGLGGAMIFSSLAMLVRQERRKNR